jgi:hypothetical protein
MAHQVSPLSALIRMQHRHCQRDKLLFVSSGAVAGHTCDASTARWCSRSATAASRSSCARQRQRDARVAVSVTRRRVSCLTRRHQRAASAGECLRLRSAAVNGRDASTPHKSSSGAWRISHRLRTCKRAALDSLTESKSPLPLAAPRLCFTSALLNDATCTQRRCHRGAAPRKWQTAPP